MRPVTPSDRPRQKRRPLDRAQHHREAIARTVRAERGRVGWSQTELADRLGWGEAGRRQVMRLEAGGMAATFELVEELGQALGCGLGPLLASLRPTADDTLEWIDRETATWKLDHIEELVRDSGSAMQRPELWRLIRASQGVPTEELAVIASLVEGRVHHRQG